jgi:DUF4097 and DUF4098 domain-containing protein YvlB
MKSVAANRLSLVMVALSLAAVCALPAQADEWSKTFNLTGKPDLRIETSDANIRVETWDQNTIEARVTTVRYKIGEDGIKIEEHQTGNVVELEVRYPHSHSIVIDWGQRRVDIVIHMPREGKVNLRTTDGKIEIGGLKGEMDLHSGDGSETLDAVDGKLRATTGDGHIRANGRFDELDVKTGDGRVDVRAAAGSSLSSAWRMETGDGNVSLEIPENLAADVDLHTGDGHIDLEIPVTSAGKVRENEVRGKMNGGGNLMTFRRVAV